MANSTPPRPRPPRPSASYAVVLIVVAASVILKPSAAAAAYSPAIAGAVNAFAQRSPYAAAFLSCALNGAAADWVAQSSERRGGMATKTDNVSAVATELARGGQHAQHCVAAPSRVDDEESDHEGMSDGTETPPEESPATVATTVVSLNRPHPPSPRPRHDFRRTAAFLLYGGCYQGASLHFIYNDLFARIFGPGGQNALAKTAASQLVMAPLLTLPVAYVFRGMVSGTTLRESLREYWVGLTQRGLLLKFWKMWIPVQFLVFTVIPVHLRVPFSSLFSFVWTVVLSRVANS